jgi:transcriptional regulator of acetoin/glycerol metabolism
MTVPTPISVRGHVHRIHEIVERGRAGDVSELVSSSWTRCLRDYQLDPSTLLRPTVLTDGELQACRARSEDVIECAKHEMTTLFQQLGDPELAVVLVDTDGVILHMVAAPDFSQEVGRAGFRVGAIWSEGEVGTNGMGTCLVVGEPVVVRQHEHFNARFTQLTCSAVPIFDPEGRLVAVLDVTSRSPLMQQHSLVLLGMTAQMIENRLIDRRHREDYPVHFHSRPELVYTLHEGMLVVGADGLIRAANRSALFQLGFDNVAAVRDKRLDEVFQVSLDDIVSRSVRSSFHPVAAFSVSSSSRFFMVAQQPASRAVPARERGAAAVAAPAVAAPAGPAGHFGDARLTRQLALAGRVVARRIPVLLHGETGSGKEIFARALHQASPCSEGPFVAVNCASLPEGLIESELFGYRAGAFTGAQRHGRRGKILQADRGTLFLDEIGDMPLSLQARLLRVLDERLVTPLGSEDPVPVEFQLVSASHRHLPAQVAEGLFREDLYFRLCGLEVMLPPLRERTDRRELIGRILDEEAGRPMGLAPEVEALLMGHAWPGNLRQLRHVLRTAAVLCEGECLELAHLPPSMRPAGLATEPAADEAPSLANLNPIEANERQVLLQLLEAQHWNVSHVAKALGVSRNTLYRKFHRLHIDLKPPR